MLYHQNTGRDKSQVSSPNPCTTTIQSQRLNHCRSSSHDRVGQIYNSVQQWNDSSNLQWFLYINRIKTVSWTTLRTISCWCCCRVVFYFLFCFHFQNVPFLKNEFSCCSSTSFLVSPFLFPFSMLSMWYPRVSGLHAGFFFILLKVHFSIILSITS